MKFFGTNSLNELLVKIKQYFIKKSDTVEAETISIDTTPTANSSNLITSGGVKTELDLKATKTEVNAKYTKPSTGIPKTDLASGVQTSLGKADTALQTSNLSFSDTGTSTNEIKYVIYNGNEYKFAGGDVSLIPQSDFADMFANAPGGSLPIYDGEVV